MELSQLSAELQREFPQLLRGVLHYNSTYDEWKTELKQMLTEVGFLPGGEE